MKLYWVTVMDPNLNIRDHTLSPPKKKGGGVPQTFQWVILDEITFIYTIDILLSISLSS